MNVEELDALPGGDLVRRGLEDLSLGSCATPEALLVQIAAPRLSRAGLSVPTSMVQSHDAELRLYALLRADGRPDPYGRYRSLIRRLVSCEAALEQLSRRRAEASVR